VTYDPLLDPPRPARGCVALLVSAVLAVGLVAYMLAAGVVR
jgi:hypothetical protein